MNWSISCPEQVPRTGEEQVGGKLVLLGLNRFQRKVGTCVEKGEAQFVIDLNGIRKLYRALRSATSLGPVMESERWQATRISANRRLLIRMVPRSLTLTRKPEVFRFEVVFHAGATKRHVHV
jgi:hypothetical protein